MNASNIASQYIYYYCCHHHHHHHHCSIISMSAICEIHLAEVMPMNKSETDVKSEQTWFDCWQINLYSQLWL